jgi:hypothetical protein
MALLLDLIAQCVMYPKVRNDKGMSCRTWPLHAKVGSDFERVFCDHPADQDAPVWAVA